MYLVTYWNAILNKFISSAQRNWKALFKSYSIVSKAELLRNKKGKLVKIKHDLVTNSVAFHLFQISDLIVIHLLFLYFLFPCFCITVFLYFCSNDGSHQIGCYPIVLPLLSITSSISFPQWLITTTQDAVFEYLLYIINCVTKAPLLYFVRSWVALSFKVCESVRQACVTPFQISTLCNL